MKILFINFNLGSTPGINNGLAILSAVLKIAGHKTGLIFLCEQLDHKFNLKRIKKDVIAFNPDIVAISLMEPQLKYMIDFCDDLRSYYHGFVICGGPYPTMAPEDMLSINNIDAVCIGEGEGAISELVEALKVGADYTKIRNMWFKLHDGTIIKNRLRPFINLESLPTEDKELFELDKLLPLKNYQLETMLGRGCPYGCSYCVNQSYLDRYKNLCDSEIDTRRYVRIKNIDTTIREIKETIARHPKVKKIAFIDDNLFVYNHAIISEFFKKYKKEIQLPFVCNANPLSFSSSKGSLLKKAGCDDIRFGIESGSERIKKDILKRPISNGDVVNSFKITKKLDLMTSSFNMIGLPTESTDEIFKTLRLNASIVPDTIKVMTFYPFKNTPIYDLCERLKLIDFDKKRELDNYDTFTCLKFPPEQQLFIKKIQAVFNWYINLFLDNDGSSQYGMLINDIKKMGEGEWNKFDFYEVDQEVSQKLRKRKILHYSKFMNRSLAVKFPSNHLSEVL